MSTHLLVYVSANELAFILDGEKVFFLSQYKAVWLARLQMNVTCTMAPVLFNLLWWIVGDLTVLMIMLAMVYLSVWEIAIG